jgi:hypothetical protein
MGGFDIRTITKGTMKTLLAAVTAAFSCLTAVGPARAADTPVAGFIREEATVALDTKGSQLEFLKAKDGRLSWTLIWVDNSTSRESLSMDKDGFFKGDGWFVYIESPARIWLFDGVRDLDLVQRAPAYTSRQSVVAKGIFETCPQKVWDALPESVRKRLHELHKA